MTENTENEPPAMNTQIDLLDPLESYYNEPSLECPLY